MKRLISAFMVIAVLLLSAADLSAKKKKPYDKFKYPKLNAAKLPSIEKGKTANGIRIRTIKSDKLPVVTVYALVKGGDLFDPADKVGLASLTAQMLKIGGTKDYTPEKLDKVLDENAISINISSSDTYFIISVSSLKERMDKAVEILGSMLKSPTFKAEKLKELKSQYESGISRRNDQAPAIRDREFKKLVYGKTPYAAEMEYEHLDNIEVIDIAKCAGRFFGPSNTLMGAIGPVTVDEVKAVVEKHLGNWNSSASAPTRFPEVKEIKHDFKVGFTNKDSLNQSYIALGHLGPKREFKELAAINVFNSIFAQGFNSRMMQKVRTEMGLTYGIGGGIFPAVFYRGRTLVSTFTKCESTLPAINAMLGVIDDIRKREVTPKELADAKNYFINSNVFKNSTPSKLLLNSLLNEFHEKDPSEDKKLIENIRKVTAADVLRVAKEYLKPEQLVIYVVGKEKLIKGKLSDIGKVKKIDISIKPPALKEKIPAATAATIKKGTELFTNLFNKKYKGYKKMRSIETVTDSQMKFRGMNLAMKQRTVRLFPDKQYVNVAVMGMKTEVIINGKKGIVKNPMGKTQALPEKDIEKGKFGDLYHICHNMKNYKFQYLWEKEVEGKKYDVVYVFNDAKKWVKFYIDKATGYIGITEKISDNPMMSGITKIFTSEYKVYRNVPVAMKSVTFVKGKQVGSSKSIKVVVNGKVKKSLFVIK